MRIPVNRNPSIEGSFNLFNRKTINTENVRSISKSCSNGKCMVLSQLRLNQMVVRVNLSLIDKYQSRHNAGHLDLIPLLSQQGCCGLINEPDQLTMAGINVKCRVGFGYLLAIHNLLDLFLFTVSGY